MSDDRTVSVQQAMAIAGVSRRTLFYWIAKGKVESKMTDYGARRIVLATLPRPYIRAQQLHPES